MKISCIKIFLTEDKNRVFFLVSVEHLYKFKIDMCIIMKILFVLTSKSTPKTASPLGFAPASVVSLYFEE